VVGETGLHLRDTAEQPVDGGPQLNHTQGRMGEGDRGARGQDVVVQVSADIEGEHIGDGVQRIAARVEHRCESRCERLFLQCGEGAHGRAELIAQELHCL
jgi:hypothetical protein